MIITGRKEILLAVSHCLTQIPEHPLTLLPLSPVTYISYLAAGALNTVNHEGNAYKSNQTVQTIDPSDLFPCQEEHYQHHEYSVRQDPVGAVRGVFSLSVYFSMSRHHNRENHRREHKG
jgi:hypothetical protein